MIFLQLFLSKFSFLSLSFHLFLPHLLYIFHSCILPSSSFYVFYSFILHFCINFYTPIFYIFTFYFSTFFIPPFYIYFYIFHSYIPSFLTFLHFSSRFYQPVIHVASSCIFHCFIYFHLSSPPPLPLDLYTFFFIILKFFYPLVLFIFSYFSCYGLVFFLPRDL